VVAEVGLTVFVDHIEGGVCEVIIFEEVVGRAGERAHEDRVVLRGDEGDGGKAQVELASRHHAEGQAESCLSLSRRAVEVLPFLEDHRRLPVLRRTSRPASCHALAPTRAPN
jgi:hypothetical protein